jgi:hypothetical protein
MRAASCTVPEELHANLKFNLKSKRWTQTTEPPCIMHGQLADWLTASPLGLKLHLLCLVPDGLEQHTRQVALSKGGQHHGNDLALVLGLSGNLWGAQRMRTGQGKSGRLGWVNRYEGGTTACRQAHHGPLSIHNQRNEQKTQSLAFQTMLHSALSACACNF